MMFFVVAIMGCGDAPNSCAEARIEPARYASAAQCRAAMTGALARNSDLDFPVVTASCRQIGQTMAARGGNAGG